MTRILSISSVIISLAALAISFLSLSKSPNSSIDQEEVRKLVLAELEARDRAHIAFLAPKAKMVYQDMLPPDRFNPATFQPTSYEELFSPLFVVISGMYSNE